MSSPVVGIDLGTTNTVVAAVRDGQAAALATEQGDVLIPSVVSFHPSGSVLVGPEAKARRKIDAKNTIYSVKRLIGRSWDTDEVRVARQRFPFEMREGPGQSALVVARKETYTLPEISAFVLRKAKAVAEAALGTTVERAVITVPANFNDLQRAATKVAGRVAGLEVMRILNEPTAAALAYGYGKQSSERIAVYDFGGGTLDITLLDLSDNVFEVLATAGDTFLGGDDIDHAICDRMAEVLLSTHRVDAKADPATYELLRWAAEDIKKQLTSTPRAMITIPEVAHQAGGKAIDFGFSMTRTELERLIAPIVARTFEVCREALGIAQLEPDAFSQVLLVGGSTRIPLVRAEVERFFGTKPITTLNPDEVVALGAAIQANALSGAEKRRSQLPLPPNPAARARLPSYPGIRPRQSSLPPGESPEASSAPAETASYGRRRQPTARGLQPTTPATQPFAGRAAPLVAPPVAGQPSVGVPVTADIAVAKKRTTALGLGGPPAGSSTDAGRTRTRTDRGLGSRGAFEPETKAPAVAVPPPRSATAGATLRSAAEQAALARAAVAASDAATQAPTPPVFDIEDDAPTEVRSALASSRDEPALDEDFLDASELHELPHSPSAVEEIEEDEEETQARQRPPAPSAPILVQPLLTTQAPTPAAQPAPPTLTRPAATLPLAPPLSSLTAPTRPSTTQPLPAVPARPAAPLPATTQALPAVTQPLPTATQPLPAAPAPSGGSPPWAAAPAPQPSETFDLPLPGIPAAAAGFGLGVAGAAHPPQLATGRAEPPLLIDVTPLTLSVETVGGYCDTVISRNTPIPCEHSRQFATVTDNQESVRVRVSQGEAPVFAQNTLLGEVLLSGLRAAPRGGVTIEVAFALDPSGMLNVNATDVGTGRSVSTQIRLVGLGDAREVESMRARHAALPLR